MSSPFLATPELKNEGCHKRLNFSAGNQQIIPKVDSTQGLICWYMFPSLMSLQEKGVF